MARRPARPFAQPDRGKSSFDGDGSCTGDAVQSCLPRCWILLSVFITEMTKVEPGHFYIGWLLFVNLRPPLLFPIKMTGGGGGRRGVLRQQKTKQQNISNLQIKKAATQNSVILFYKGLYMLNRHIEITNYILLSLGE
jgi:hypothetical protein